jgi:hypothetical protein
MAVTSAVIIPVFRGGFRYDCDKLNENRAMLVSTEVPLADGSSRVCRVDVRPPLT